MKKWSTSHFRSTHFHNAVSVSHYSFSMPTRNNLEKTFNITKTMKNSF